MRTGKRFLIVLLLVLCVLAAGCAAAAAEEEEEEYPFLLQAPQLLKAGESLTVKTVGLTGTNVDWQIDLYYWSQETDNWERIDVKSKSDGIDPSWLVYPDEEFHFEPGVSYQIDAYASYGAESDWEGGHDQYYYFQVYESDGQDDNIQVTANGSTVLHVKPGEAYTVRYSAPGATAVLLMNPDDYSQKTDGEDSFEQTFSQEEPGIYQYTAKAYYDEISGYLDELPYGNIGNICTVYVEDPDFPSEGMSYETDEALTLTVSAEELYTGNEVTVTAAAPGAEKIRIFARPRAVELAQAVQTESGTSCTYAIQYNVEAELTYWAEACYDGEWSGKYSEKKTVRFISHGRLGEPAFECETSFLPGEPITVTRTNRVEHEEQCLLFLTETDHTPIINGRSFEDGDTLTVEAPDEEGEYLLSVLVMAPGWSNNETTVTITVGLGNSGEVGGGTWTLDGEGVLTVSGPANLNGWNLPSGFRQKIKEVRYGAEVSYIPEGLFSYSYDLVRFTVDPGNPYYCSVDGVLYSRDKTRLIEAPTALSGELTIPEGVTRICRDAFIGSYLSRLNLPSTLEEVERQAFWNAEFESLHLPARLEYIDDTALNVSILESFSVAADNPVYSARDGLLYSKDGTELIHYAPGRTDDTWETPDGVEKIGPYAFAFADSLEQLTLREGVTVIGGSAMNWSGVKRVSFPASLETIETGAFEYSHSLESAEYAGTVEQLGEVLVESKNKYLAGLQVTCTDGTGEFGVSQGPDSGDGGMGIWSHQEIYYMDSDLPLDYPGPDQLYMNPTMAQLGPNVDLSAMRAAYPEGPEWTLEQKSGTAAAKLEEYYNEYEASVMLKVTALPGAPEKDVWTVGCTWGDQSWEAEIPVTFKKLTSRPEGVECTAAAGRWQVKVGDLVQPHGVFQFRNGWKPAGVDYLSVSWGGQNDFWNALEDRVTSEGWWMMYAKLPGTYKCEITLEAGNLGWRINTFLYIADKNGNVPAYQPELNVWGTVEPNVYILPLDESYSSLFSSKSIGSIYINNMEEFAGTAGKPSWKIEQVSGTLRCKLDVLEGDSSVNILLKSMPSKAETMKFKVSCTWGKNQWEQTYTVKFRKPASRPSGIISPAADGRWTVTAGEKIYVDDLFDFRDGWKISEGAQQTFTFFSGCDTQIFFDHLQFDYREGKRFFTVTEPGFYRVDVTLNQANVCWKENLELLVLNEDGSMPQDYYSAFRSSAASVLEPLVCKFAA